MKITVYGAGAWGTALAIRWAQAHDVTLVARREAHAAQLAADRQNITYLPGQAFPENLKIAPQVPPAPALIVLGVPTSGLCDALDAVSAHADEVRLIGLCKGFVGNEAALPAEIMRTRWRAPYGMLFGPSFAQEVARGLPAAIVLASHDAAFANAQAIALSDDALRIYPSTDVVGVEIGGAVKNVLAIAAGLCDGLQLGANARAALITRGLAEITRLALALGGKAETVSGLAGLGDLVLTCTGDLSRNRRVGMGLAQGLRLADISRDLGHVAEGIPAAQKTIFLARKIGVEMPICEAVAAMLEGQLSPQQAVVALMSRNVRLA